MKIAVIIPTYNEKGNIAKLIPKIFSLNISGLEAVVVDDNSPDGTGEVVENMGKLDSRIHVIHRSRKMGLGTAYMEGFKYALQNGSEYIFEMDADFSHNPVFIPVFLRNIKNCDLVLGSRYISRGGIENWDFLRRFVSRAGNLYARAVLNLSICDLTTGFKCYRRVVVEDLVNRKVGSIGYVFQIETTYRAYQSGFKIKEIPIVFTERRLGSSKFDFKIIWESFWKVLKLRFFG